MSKFDKIALNKIGSTGMVPRSLSYDKMAKESCKSLLRWRCSCVRIHEIRGDFAHEVFMQEVVKFAAKECPEMARCRFHR